MEGVACQPPPVHSPKHQDSNLVFSALTLFTGNTSLQFFPPRNHLRGARPS